MSSIFSDIREAELRDICRQQIETFESWSRRLIHEQFKEKYGDDYFNHMIIDGQPLIKSEIKQRIEKRIVDNPGRFPRIIDAILLEDVEYFCCRDDLYSTIFKPILEPFYSGQNEIRSVLKRIIAIRNKLSHGNTISYHEAEQCICYSNDFINVYKKYYQNLGRAKDYNVPVFLQIKDSLGNNVFREDSSYSWELFFDGRLGPKVQLRSGDEYKLWVEVDSSFEDSLYSIEWCVLDGSYNQLAKGIGNEVRFVVTNKMVSFSLYISIKLTTKKEWHRFAHINCDDLLEIHLKEVLPPIENTY